MAYKREETHNIIIHPKPGARKSIWALLWAAAAHAQQPSPAAFPGCTLATSWIRSGRRRLIWDAGIATWQLNPLYHRAAPSSGVLENSLAFPYICLPYGSLILFLSIYLQEMKTYINQKIVNEWL